MQQQQSDFLPVTRVKNEPSGWAVLSEMSLSSLHFGAFPDVLRVVRMAFRADEHDLWLLALTEKLIWILHTAGNSRYITRVSKNTQKQMEKVTPPKNWCLLKHTGYFLCEVLSSFVLFLEVWRIIIIVVSTHNDKITFIFPQIVLFC